MSAAAELRAEAERMKGSASELELYIADSRHHWSGLALSGTASDAARRALQRATDTLLEPAQQMRLAARILSLYAPLQERIEQLRARALQLAATPAFAEPTSVALGQLDALADVLDWACARQLNALCTPEMAQPPSRLEDFSDLSLTELHQIQLTMASEEVRSLAAANPDITVLEASPGRLVALVDPEGIGTQAAQVSTFVGGVGSSDAASWPTAVERARAIARATNGPTVAWIGYAAPTSLPRAAHEDPARRGATELGRFQRALRQRFPHAQHILLGYSYGSVVVGKAAQQDYVADDVVLIGSPGASVASASQLHGRVWSARNTEDPIAIATGPHGGIHGPDPSSPTFGATAVPVTSGLPGNHGSSWKDPAFLRGLGVIASRY